MQREDLRSRILLLEKKESEKSKPQKMEKPATQKIEEKLKYYSADMTEAYKMNEWRFPSAHTLKKFKGFSTEELSDEGWVPLKYQSPQVHVDLQTYPFSIVD